MASLVRSHRARPLAVQPEALREEALRDGVTNPSATATGEALPGKPEATLRDRPSELRHGPVDWRACWRGVAERHAARCRGEAAAAGSQRVVLGDLDRVWQSGRHVYLKETLAAGSDGDPSSKDAASSARSEGARWRESWAQASTASVVASVAPGVSTSAVSTPAVHRDRQGLREPKFSGGRRSGRLPRQQEPRIGLSLGANAQLTPVDLFGGGAVDHPNRDVLDGARPATAVSEVLRRRVPSGTVGAAAEAPSRDLPAADAPELTQQGEPSHGSPWISVARLSRPDEGDDRLFEEAGRELGLEGRRPWFVCHEPELAHPELAWAEAPSWIHLPRTSPFRYTLPADSEFARALKTVVRRKFYREVRRSMKDQWRQLYKDSLTMNYDVYEERLQRINSVGRLPGESDQFNSDYHQNRLRDTVFEEDENLGEREIPIVSLGPLVFLDSGSVRLDLGSVLALDSDGKMPKGKPGEGEGPRPMIASENFRFDTKLRVGFDPMESFEQDGDLTWMIKRYGVSFSVDWLSGVLGREIVSTEFEARVDRDGDFAFAVNLVIDSD